MRRGRSRSRGFGPTIVPIAKVKQLGRIPPDLDYVVIDGQEYSLLASVYEEAPDPRGQAGQVYVSVPRMIRDEDTGQSMQVGAMYRRALPVKEGTYAREAERQARRIAPLPMQRADALRHNPLLRLQPNRLSPTAIIELLSSRGVRLRVTDDGSYLIAEAPGGRLRQTRDLVREAEPLLRAHLLGQPLQCALPHPKGTTPDAVTLIEPSGIPACAACADEEAVDGQH